MCYSLNMPGPGSVASKVKCSYKTNKNIIAQTQQQSTIEINKWVKMNEYNIFISNLKTAMQYICLKTC